MSHRVEDIMQRPVGYTRSGIPIYLMVPPVLPGHPEKPQFSADLAGLGLNNPVKEK